MAKRNVTFSYFDRKKPHAVVPVFTGDCPGNRVPIHRLSWSRNERQINWSDLARTITESALPDAAFVLDSSFLDRHEIPNDVFAALTSRRVLFTPQVWTELTPWLTTPFAHRSFREEVIRATKDSSKSISLLAGEEWAEAIRSTSSYYISMLSTRKLIGHQVINEFIAVNHRDPNREELESILKSRFRDRGLVLAQKGLVDHQKDNFLADEELVVYSVVHAILTGRETTILTRDRDVLEQFYKFGFMLDTHYRAHLIAEAFIATPENLIEDELQLPEDHKFLFEGPASLLHIPPRFMEWILPKEWTAVNASCILLGGHDDQMKSTMLTHCFEREISSILEVKGISGGRNYFLSDDKNCHILISPPFSTHLRGHAIIAKDHSDSDVNLVDLNYAVMEIEGFKSLSPIAGGKDAETSLGFKLADFCLIDRMTYSEPPRWIDMPPSEIAKAISLVHPASLILFDLSFLEASHAPEIEDAILQRGFGTTTNVRNGLIGPGKSEAIGKLGAAVAESSSRSIHLYDLGSEFLRSCGFGYYLGLLAYRKLFGQVIASEIESENGKAPAIEEVLARIESLNGLYGRRLAEDGWRRSNDPTLFFAEELLVLGFFTAITEGTDVVIVTQEPLLIDQFMKLSGTVAMDYQAHRYWKTKPQVVKELASQIDASGSEWPKHLYESKVLQFRPDSSWESLLSPKQPYLANVHCWLVDDTTPPVSRIAAMTFCAERPMYHLLKTKGQFLGSNIPDSSGVNLRIGFAQPGGLKPFGFIGRDRHVAYGTKSFPSDDRLNLKIGGVPAMDLMLLINRKADYRLPYLESES